MYFERNRKKIRMLWWMFIIFSNLLLGVLSVKYNLSNSIKILIFWSLFIVEMIAWFVINQLWYKEFLRKVESLTPILEEENDADRFIVENLSLLKGKKSMQIIAILKINICEGYCKKGDYQKAKAHLTEINPKKIHGLLRVYYQLIFIYVLFYLKETEEAMKQMANQWDTLLKFENSPELGAMISIVRIFQLLTQKKKQEANDLLHLSKEKWKKSNYQKDFYYLEALCEEILHSPS